MVCKNTSFLKFLPKFNYILILMRLRLLLAESFSITESRIHYKK